MNRPLTPSLSPSAGERVPEGRVRGWFMVPMHAEKRKEALDEPSPLSRVSAERRSLLFLHIAARSATPGFTVPMRSERPGSANCAANLNWTNI